MDVPNLNIRRAQPSSLAQLIALSQAAGSAAHWTRQQWLDIFESQSPPRLAWIAVPAAEAEAEGHPIGFLVAQSGGPEWELENIAVLPEFRCRGVGRQLLAALLTHARALGAERIFLEVRASNQPAIRFYNLSGFQQLASRRDYYRDPDEDALILVHEL
jgi:ribosomal-protein-alanine N-acetyltransferase